LKNSLEATRINPTTLSLSLYLLFSFSFSFSFSLTLRCVVLCCLIHTTTYTESTPRRITVSTAFFFPYSFWCFLRRAMYVASMRKSFKDSLKLLEADIQHANTLLVLSLSLSLQFSFNIFIL
jgi:hypothetical protein